MHHVMYLMVGEQDNEFEEQDKSKETKDPYHQPGNREKTKEDKRRKGDSYTQGDNHVLQVMTTGFFKRQQFSVFLFFLVQVIDLQHSKFFFLSNCIERITKICIAQFIFIGGSVVLLPVIQLAKIVH